MLPTSIMVSFNDFQQQTLDIVESFVHCSVDDSWTSRTSIVTAILQLVDEFNKTCVSKNVFDETWCALSDYKGFCKHYEKILDQVFLDVNWGRIIAMFAMLSDFAQRLNQEQQHNLLHQLVLDTSTFVSSRLYDFISKHGGWVSTLSVNVLLLPKY